MNNSQEQNQTKSKQFIKHKKSILAIDDDDDILNLNSCILEMEGYEVYTATSGPEALLVLENIALPDLILLDMKMKDCTGLDFLHSLELIRPDVIDQVPVVFLTGMDTVPKSVASGFIRKPYDALNFAEQVHSCIKNGRIKDF